VAGPAFTTAGEDLIRIMVITQARRIRTRVTPDRGDITRIHTMAATRTIVIHIMAVIRTVVTAIGQLGYYHGVVDGVIGPQTRGAIAAFESRNGLAVDGTISRPLLDRLGVG